MTVHTESIIIDSIWEEIKKRSKRGDVLKWYVMTPVNAPYFKSEFNISLPKKKLDEIMKKRYRWMIANKQKLELHLHLSMIMENMSYKAQDKLFKDAISWMKKELGVTPKEFVPGWWAYNKDTLDLCKKYRMKMIYERDYDYTHDFQWV